MEMYTGNLGLLFYKDYFLNEERETIFEWDEQKAGVGVKKGNEEYIKKLNKKLTEWKMMQEEIEAEKNIYKLSEKTSVLKFKTTYPGLLIGSGYNHDVSVDEAFKLGMEFDYTSGLPIIPASSVKGVLRSAFPSKQREEDKKSREEYIASLLKEIGINMENDMGGIIEIEKNIFEGIKNGQRLPVYSRDVFYDATIAVNENKNKNILNEDYITPHKNELQNPVPIKFLKLNPDTYLEFRFKLTDMDDKINKDVKEKLLKRILLDLGVGSKTNVGYGQLVEVRL